MAYFFVILFFVAVVGIFRPYKFIAGSKRWHYGLGAFALFMLVGITAPETEVDGGATSTEVSAGEEGQASSDNDTPSSVEAEPKSTSKWVYNEQRDEMRGTVRKYAELESENSHDLDFPYGEQSGFITIRHDPKSGLDVMFSVRSGQILCHGFGDSYLNVKFDDGPIRRFNCTDASDGSNEVAFIRDARTFVASLKKASRTVIEAEFFRNGRRQYAFNTDDLEWE